MGNYSNCKLNTLLVSEVMHYCLYYRISWVFCDAESRGCAGRNATVHYCYYPILLSCGDCTSTGAVSQTINQGQQVCTASDTPIQLNIYIRLGYPAANTSSTKDMSTCYLSRLELLHSTW